jgi:hypothetical protein
MHFVLNPISVFEKKGLTARSITLEVNLESSISADVIADPKLKKIYSQICLPSDVKKNRAKVPKNAAIKDIHFLIIALLFYNANYENYICCSNQLMSFTTLICSDVLIKGISTIFEELNK